MAVLGVVQFPRPVATADPSLNHVPIAPGGVMTAEL